MLNLHGKLALALFALLLVLAVLFIGLTTWLLRAHDLEVRQQANAALADNVARSALLMLDGKTSDEALMECFKELVRLNPDIEAYLVSPDGDIITSSSSDLARSRLGLEPIHAFLADAPLPIYGDDPKRADGRIVFSAAPLPDTPTPSAYLYLALQRDASVTPLEVVGQISQGSLAARLALWSTALVCAVTFLLGIALFFFLTRRLRRLTQAVERYRPGDALSVAAAPPGLMSDEVDRLGNVFNQMTHTIEAQLRELREVDAQRRELITNVSHDLRTPLTSLRGYLETLQLKNGTLTLAEQEHFLEVASRQSERLGVLIHELFELAKLDAGQVTPQPEPFSLAELAQDVLAEFRLQAEAKGVRLEFEPERDVLVRGDVALLERVLANLLDNAVRHTPAGGAVALSLESVESAVGDFVQTCVTDTGEGIAAEDLPRIFERYYRPSEGHAGRAEGSGAGLGLAIATRILELHGSHFEVRSTLGQGTVFSFKLQAES